MPKNDPNFYDRIYAKIMGCYYLSPTKRDKSSKFDTNDHPLWYFRMFRNDKLCSALRRSMRLTETSPGRCDHNKGKIPLIVVMGQGGGGRDRNFVCMKIGDFRDLMVGDRAGEVERESQARADFLEWLRPDVWAEDVPCQNDTLDDDGDGLDDGNDVLRRTA